MILGVYCVRDELTTWLTPTVDYSDESAIRNFQFAMQNANSVMSKNKSDFVLYKLAEFDNVTGEISPIEMKQLMRGVDSNEIQND